MNAKRICAAIATATLLVAVTAGTASAATPSHQRHIDMAHVMVETVFYDMPLSDQSDVCFAWDMMPSYFISETASVMTGLGMSQADKRKGITSAMNEACGTYA